MTLAITVIACIVSPSFAQVEKLREVRGVIRTLDLKAGSLTLAQLFSDQQPGFSLASKELPVSDPVGKPAKLSDLREGLRVAVKVRNDAEIVAIRVDGPNVNGIVKHVDMQTRAVTFKDFIADKTVTLPTGTPIVSQGEQVSLAECKVGGAIQILYSLDRKSILQVQVGKGTHSRDPYLRVTRLFGVLADLDHATMQATIFLQSTDAGSIKTYSITPDAYLREIYHHKPVGEIPLAKLAKWVKVNYIIDRDTGRIINIDADLPVLTRRKVTKINANAITIEDEKKDKVIPLAANVQVLTPNGDGKLADVTPDRIVNCALTLDRERVRVLYLWDR